MKIFELREGMRKVDVEGMITEIRNPRTVHLKNGDTQEVADATLEDESGQIGLSLWGDEEIEKGVKGAMVRVSNGYTNSYRGEVKLSVGKYGTIEVLRKVEPQSSKSQKTLVTFSPTPVPLTEERVREIAREEFDKLSSMSG